LITAEPHNTKLSGGVSRPLERRVRRSVLLYADPPNAKLSGGDSRPLE